MVEKRSPPNNSTIATVSRLSPPKLRKSAQNVLTNQMDPESVHIEDNVLSYKELCIYHIVSTLRVECLGGWVVHILIIISALNFQCHI